MLQMPCNLSGMESTSTRISYTVHNYGLGTTGLLDWDPTVDYIAYLIRFARGELIAHASYSCQAHSMQQHSILGMHSVLCL